MRQDSKKLAQKILNKQTYHPFSPLQQALQLFLQINFILCFYIGIYINSLSVWGCVCSCWQTCGVSTRP